MIKARYWILGLLLVACCALATILQPRALNWSERAKSDNILSVLFGDGRRIFANHFFVQADVSFHSGYYPSVFDQHPAATGGHMMEHHDEHHGANDHDEDEGGDFLGKPRDWVEAFGRHFMVTEHSHLEGGNEREILPWLRLSVELDPQRVESYTVAAYFLRTSLGKTNEAEAFLREGLRNNPGNLELMTELGNLYSSAHDNVRAYNMWERALRHWREVDGWNTNANVLLLDNIAVNLARLEEASSNYEKAVYYLEMARKISPQGGELQRQIDDLKKKQKAGPSTP